MGRQFLILLLIAAVPLAEIAAFVEIGSEIGAMAVIALTVLTAALGLIIVRIQGLGTLERARTALDAGRPPVAEMLHGALLALAGLLLLIPGFLTDSAGGLLLVPAVRRALIGRIAVTGSMQDEDVIEARYWEEDLLPPHLDSPPDRRL